MQTAEAPGGPAISKSSTLEDAGDGRSGVAEATGRSPRLGHCGPSAASPRSRPAWASSVRSRLSEMPAFWFRK